MYNSIWFVDSHREIIENFSIRFEHLSLSHLLTEQYILQTSAGVEVSQTANCLRLRLWLSCRRESRKVLSLFQRHFLLYFLFIFMDSSVSVDKTLLIIHFFGDSLILKLFPTSSLVPFFLTLYCLSTLSNFSFDFHYSSNRYFV